MSGTALIYDEEMSRYQLLWDDPVCAIEIPERLTRSYEAVKSAGLEKRCVPVSVREGTEEEILLYHSKEYLEQVKQTPSMSVEELKTFTQQFGDVYFHPNIYNCAKLAIGATLQLVDSVMKGKVRNGMALVRPPGHHSQRSAANGFCVFNNVAIAALYAKKHYNLNRVLIVDWDVHHGQGVQYCFEEDPSVLYFSWHRYEHKSFWPNLDESDYNTVGKGKGTGFNINVPWNKVGMTNSDYLSVFFHVLLPAAYEFDPELVLVSAGFDSAIGDPEGHMCATPEIFGHLTHLLMSLARGKLCVVLEVRVTYSTLSSVRTPAHAALPSSCRSSEGAKLLPPGGASVMQAVIGLLLPLAYEFSPDLVLQVLTSSSGLEMPVWAQVSSLLQGLAQGRTLALLQTVLLIYEHLEVDYSCYSNTLLPLWTV
uniref:Histone deacetylase 10 n=1 Tax=Astyanax mexicanus TaxID=7994 RepID=A0A8B9RJV1_ASTMX